MTELDSKGLFKLLSTWALQQIDFESKNIQETVSFYANDKMTTAKNLNIVLRVCCFTLYIFVSVLLNLFN